MRVAVTPRVVAPPWLLSERSGRRVQVGLEDDVRPESGPVARYRAMWPDRMVTWNRARQLFEIRSTTDPGFRELVFFWDAPPDDEEKERTAEEIAEMVERGDGALVKRWMPFDDALVSRRLAEAVTYRALGANRERKQARRIADHNAMVSRRRLAESQALWDDWAKDDHRYLSELAARHAGQTPAEARTERLPLVSPGVTITTHPVSPPCQL